MGDDDDAGGTTIRDLGVVSTTELVENGEFGADTTGWTLGTSATLSSEGGRLKIANEATTNHGYAYQQVTVVVGARYKVTADLVFSAGTAVDLQLYLGTSLQGSEYFASGDITADTTITQYITATTTSLYVQAQNSGNGGTNAYFDNISVKQDDLVLNGGFDSDTIWVKGTGWSISGGKATSDNSQTGSSSLYQGLTNAVQGALYEVRYDWSYASVGNVLIYIGGQHMEGSWSSETGTNLVAYIRYTGATGASSISFYTGADSDGTVDNLSIRQVDGNPGTLVNTPTFSTDIP
jgi:hypothetical protein